MYFYIIGKKRQKNNRGIYRPWITEMILQLILKKILNHVERKIKSQKKYNGNIVFINKKYVTKVLTDLGKKIKKP